MEFLSPKSLESKPHFVCVCVCVCGCMVREWGVLGRGVGVCVFSAPEPDVFITMFFLFFCFWWWCFSFLFFVWSLPEPCVPPQLDAICGEDSLCANDLLSHTHTTQFSPHPSLSLSLVLMIRVIVCHLGEFFSVRVWGDWEARVITSFGAREKEEESDLPACLEILVQILTRLAQCNAFTNWNVGALCYI